jgi:hypothetical protein
MGCPLHAVLRAIQTAARTRVTRPTDETERAETRALPKATAWRAAHATAVRERGDFPTAFVLVAIGNRKSKIENLLAGVVQWQNGSFPSCTRGFDSPHPLPPSLAA